MVWYVLLVVAVSLPLALVSVLLAEAYSPRLDRLTLALPAGVRTAVAAMAMNNAGFGAQARAKVERVLKLDPANADAHSRMCQIASDDEKLDALELCQQAVRLEPSAINFDRLGNAQERAGDPCSAQDSYNSANSRQGGNSDYLRALGRSDFKCGRIAYSVAELLAAESFDAKSLESSQDEEADDVKADLQNDREWLTLAFAASHQPREAAESCGRAHPEWKTCACVLQGGKPVCTGEHFAGAK